MSFVPNVSAVTRRPLIKGQVLSEIKAVMGCVTSVIFLDDFFRRKKIYMGSHFNSFFNGFLRSFLKCFPYE